MTRFCAERGNLLASYIYKAVDERGSDISGTIESASKANAITDLAARGLSAYLIEEAGNFQAAPWYQRDIQFLGRVPDHEVADLAAMLARLIDKGISLTDALRAIAESSPNLAIRSALSRTVDAMLAGQDPSEAFEATDSQLPAEFRVMFRAGARANRLAETMSSGAYYFSQRSDIRERVIGALIYPVLLCIGALAVAALVLFFLVPNLYTALSASASLQTSGIARLYAVSNFVAANKTPLTGLVVCAVIAVLALRHQIGSLALAVVPPLRGLSAIASWATVARLLAVLLTSGQKLDDALHEVEVLAAHSRTKYILKEALEALRIGDSPAVVFQGDPWVPKLFQRFFALGVATNDLPALMQLTADALAQTHKTAMLRLTTLLSPALTLVIGGMIASLVYVILTAVLEVSQVAL